MVDRAVVIVGGAAIAGLVYAYFQSQTLNPANVGAANNPDKTGQPVDGSIPGSIATSASNNNHNLMQAGVGGQANIIGRTTATSPAPVPQHSATVTQASLQAYMLSKGGNPNASTADQFNWYYSALSGIHQVTDLFPAGNRGALMTVEQYFAGRAKAGI